MTSFSLKLGFIDVPPVDNGLTAMTIMNDILCTAGNE